jgi:hypothetical protein
MTLYSAFVCWLIFDEVFLLALFNSWPSPTLPEVRHANDGAGAEQRKFRVLPMRLCRVSDSAGSHAPQDCVGRPPHLAACLSRGRFHPGLRELHIGAAFVRRQPAAGDGEYEAGTVFGRRAL